MKMKTTTKSSWEEIKSVMTVIGGHLGNGQMAVDRNAWLLVTLMLPDQLRTILIKQQTECNLVLNELIF